MSVKKLKRFNHNELYENNLFTCLNLTEEKIVSPCRTSMQIAAFDPGVINTGCRIEKRHNGKITTIQQRLIKNTGSSHYFINMKNELYKIAKDLYECDYILIESQMRNNPEAIRMSQHIISTVLCITEGSNALILEILPTVKSKSFGIKGLKGRDLKMKAVEIARQILTDREDEIGLSAINACKKKDDHSDVILYCDAWARFLEVKNFSESF